MIKAVLFDMDGVLIDSYDAWLSRFNFALRHFGLKKVSVEEFDRHIWAINFTETAQKYFPGVAVKDIRDYYFKTIDRFIGSIKKIEHVDEILEYLKAKNLKLAIVSNTQRDIVEKILDKFHIRQYFDLIVGGERVRHGKPDPEIVLLACSELSLKPEEAILVGDTVYDKEAAKAAGSGFIGYKLGSVDDLIEIKKLI